MREALKDIPSEKTDFGPGKTPLYYNNKGLFSDPFIEERLPNLENYSSHPSTKYLNKYWNCEEFDHVNFNNAFQAILNLWSDKLDEDVPKYCQNEAQLEQSWIKPIFDILGWTYEVQDKIDKRGRKMWPDYSLFGSEDAWKKSKNATEVKKFFHATSVADAKAWDVSLDGKGYTNANPSFQIVTYMELTKKDWGILTNGREWRVYSLRSDSKHTTYFEIDLINILATKDTERFKYFYNFFRKEAFVKEAAISDRCFLDFVFEDGQFYSQRVEENLQSHAYRVVDTICQGFLANIKNPTEDDLKEVYEYSMYYLFKLMFVLNCESKGLLEVNKQDDYYEFSLRKRVFDLKEMHETGKNWSSQPRTYNFINDLFELLKHGDKNIGVHGFGEEPFEIGSQTFYQNNKISDEYLNDALIDLACSYDEEDNLQFIDYKILSPDHIGSLFEGLLEFNLVKKGKKINLVNTKGDRKATGSYYTPDYMVDYIVEETISPLLNGMTPKDILELNILDPSMGSGHFLLGVVKFLEKHIVMIQDSGDIKEGAIEFDRIKKSVLQNCVFGVDINSLATQLGKFSLWIYTSQKGDKLEPLSDQIITHNALLDDYSSFPDFNGRIYKGNVDVIVGNPPYIGEKGNEKIFHEVAKETLGKKFYTRWMDYFYFFFHLGLDLLKDDGKMTLISTNYFLTSTGGIKLREDIEKRSTEAKFINFNQLKIFKSAQGQHNILTFLKKGKGPSEVSGLSLEGKGKCTKKRLEEIKGLKLNKGAFEGKEKYIRIGTSGNSSEEFESVLKKMEDLGLPLTDLCDISPGLFSGADKVSNSHLKKFKVKNAKKGDGIFILTPEELSQMDLQKSDLKKYVKPFFKNSEIGKYRINRTKDLSVLYIADTGEPIKLSKKMKQHFDRFENLLVSVKSNFLKNDVAGPIVKKWLDNGNWFVLFLPKKEKYFLEEKIVCPQRSKHNIFAYSEDALYASQDVYFLIKKDKKTNLKALSGVLNSKLYYFWLYHKGKRKGEMLEMYKKPISNVPIPDLPKKEVEALERIVNKILKTSDLHFQSEIDNIVYKNFGLTPEEVKEVEKFYKSKVADEDSTEQETAA